MEILLILFALIPFYLIGALPFGYLISKAQGIDISKHGSGNVGAANITRVLGKKLGILTLLLDCGKGFLSPLIASLLYPNLTFLGAVGLVTVCGHCFSLPPYLKGGKGVATTLGVGLFFSPIAAIACLGVFIVLVLATRIVSLASLVAIASAPIAAEFSNTPEPIVGSLAIIALIVAFKHRSNLIRLSQGEESKFERA